MTNEKLNRNDKKMHMQRRILLKSLHRRVIRLVYFEILKLYIYTYTSWVHDTPVLNNNFNIKINHVHVIKTKDRNLKCAI